MNQQSLNDLTVYFPHAFPEDFPIARRPGSGRDISLRRPLGALFSLSASFRSSVQICWVLVVFFLLFFEFIEKVMGYTFPATFSEL